MAPRVRLLDNVTMRFVVRLLGNMLGIWVASLLVSGIVIVSGTSTGETILVLGAIALVFTVVNTIARPVISTLAFPLYIVTFGLFALVTNALVFLLTGWLAGSLGLPLTVDGFWAALLGGTITAVISAVVVAVLGDK
jgi:putative membrane protein